MSLILDVIEVRLLGCLIEKGFTTPDIYPLTLNALTSAANQKSNRDPLMELAEPEILRALDRLREEKRLVIRINAGGSGRAAKYEHTVANSLSLHPSEQALLAELLLRGPQTAAELRTRASRMFPLESAEQVDQALQGLSNRETPLILQLPRLPGQRESRFIHLLGGPIDLENLPSTVAPPEKTRLVIQSENQRIDKLEAEVVELRQKLDQLQLAFEQLHRQLH